MESWCFAVLMSSFWTGDLNRFVGLVVFGYVAKSEEDAAAGLGEFVACLREG